MKLETFPTGENRNQNFRKDKEVQTCFTLPRSFVSFRYRLECEVSMKRITQIEFISKSLRVLTPPPTVGSLFSCQLLFEIAISPNLTTWHSIKIIFQLAATMEQLLKHS
jgi:hypothetical protein